MRRVHLGLLLVPFAAACGGGKGSAEATPPPGAPAATAVTYTDARGELFVRKGCPQCHSISAFGIKSPTEVGPDLTAAYEDVQTRFGLKLDQFLATPTGTMQVVLSSMITLTPAERDSIVHILKELHEEREERAEHEKGNDP
ncbi:MAG TPA: hypothetical protein VFO67_15055 [Gemmatimonadales bacterium]|nr:hypothetical protein [Gemmatimonadales bacterium]